MIADIASRTGLSERDVTTVVQEMGAALLSQQYYEAIVRLIAENAIEDGKLRTADARFELAYLGAQTLIRSVLGEKVLTPVR